MEIIDLIYNLTQAQEVLKKMAEDPQKKPLVKNLVNSISNIIGAAINFTNSNDNFLVLFAGKKKGQNPITINFSMINDFSDTEYKAMLEGLAASLDQMTAHHEEIKKEKEKNESSECKIAEINKTEDGVIIKFNQSPDIASQKPA